MIATTTRARAAGALALLAAVPRLALTACAGVSTEAPAAAEGTATEDGAASVAEALDVSTSPEQDRIRTTESAEAIGNRSLLFVRNGNSWHGVREIRAPQGRLRKVFIVVIERATLAQRLRRLLDA